MTSHVGRALDEMFLLQIVHQAVVERKHGFGCGSELGKLVAGRDTPAVVIEKFGQGAIYNL